MIWFTIGLFLGYAIGVNRSQSNIPKDLEKCNFERDRQEQDIAYYKKLTKNLVEENKELRQKINVN